MKIREFFIVFVLIFIAFWNCAKFLLTILKEGIYTKNTINKLNECNIFNEALYNINYS